MRGGEAPRQIFAIAPRADRSLGSQMSGGQQKCFDSLGASPFVGLCEVTCDGQCGQVEFQPQAGQSRMGGKTPASRLSFVFPHPPAMSLIGADRLCLPAGNYFPLLEVERPCLPRRRSFSVLSLTLDPLWPAV